MWRQLHPEGIASFVLDALGGALTIESAPGRGATVSGTRLSIN